MRIRRSDAWASGVLLLTFVGYTVVLGPIGLLLAVPWIIPILAAFYLVATAREPATWSMVVARVAFCLALGIGVTMAVGFTRDLISFGDFVDHPPEWVRIQPPVVRECGSIPAGPWVVTVKVTESGDIYLPGIAGPMSLLGLHDYLRDVRMERGHPGRGPGRENAIDLVLEIDRRVPWPFVAAFVQMGLSAVVSIRHYYFVVKNRLDGVKGALAFAWSGNFGLDTTRFIEDGADLTVVLRPSSGFTDFRGLHERMARLDPETLQSAIVRIRGSRAVDSPASWGTLAGVFDAALGAGARRLEDLPTTSLGSIQRLWWLHISDTEALALQRAWIHENRASLPGVVFRLDGEVLPALEHAAPRGGGGRHDAPWGWTGNNVERSVSDDDD